jgi:hypothetical protein
VRSLLVIVADIAAQQPPQMALAKHQRPVQALHLHGLDPPLGVGVRLRRPNRRAQHLSSLAEHLVEERVNLASWSRSRNRIDNCRSFSSIVAFLACWVTQAESGLAVTPTATTRLVLSWMKNNTPTAS